MVADLEDFVDKNIYHLIGAKHFNLHMHRTEVVKKPAGMCDEPVFPLANRYYRANYSLEGLEARNKAEIPGCDAKVYEGMRPEVTDEEWLKESV